MKKYFFFVLAIGGTLTLAGCKTPEIRSDPAIDNNLTFYSDTTKKNDEEAAKKTTEETDQGITQKSPINPRNAKKMYPSQPPMTLDGNKQYQAILKTELGDIVIDLAAQATPITVNNFVFLAREKFYDQTIFHRTIPGFMIQGGDPEGTGVGGPGYQFADEPFQGKYERGTVAMANAGPNTNGSQFFIMHADAALPHDYVMFGKVASRMEAVDKIATAPTKPGGEGSTPVSPIKILTAEIKEK